MLGWVFLAFSLTAASFTLNVFFPRRSRALLLPSFFFGWLVGELPLHIGWQAACAAGFVALGALSSPPGAAALALLVASWVGLLLSIAQSQRAGSVIEAALDRALGKTSSLAISDPVAQRLQSPIGRWRLLWPFHFRHRDVEVIYDIAYADVGGPRNHLDVYRPRQRVERAPVLLQIHGGGWIVGNKRQQALPLLVDLAARGFVCVSANYRLSPRATFPDHLIDLKRALIWVRRHIAEHGGDPSFVVVTGGSAGGHLAALLALTPNLPEYQPGNEDVDTRVQGCIPFYGVYDLAGLSSGKPPDHLVGLWEQRVLKRKLAAAREAFELASPIGHVHAEAPPFFVIQGSHDSVVSVEDARAFAAALATASNAPVVYAELPGAQHAFDLFHSIRTHHAIAGIRRFLTWLIAHRAR
ncbi:MAG: alpha/beta hydrolase fold domain-containing protein, partial [Polyangiales bacterium]